MILAQAEKASIWLYRVLVNLLWTIVLKEAKLNIQFKSSSSKQAAPFVSNPNL